MEVHNEHSLVNLSNSILRHFHIKPFHDSIPEIDTLLADYKKVVLVLFDGMGKNILRYHLKYNSYLRSHRVTTINSTFPPTTAAATTSLLTGKYPIETGWIAWNSHFPELDRNIILFRGSDINTKELIDKDIAYKKYPNKNLEQLINESGNAKATFVQRYPVQEKGPKTLRNGLKQVRKALKSSEDAFVYFYWDSPDREMHVHGIHSLLVKFQVLKAQWFVKRLAKQNPDAVIIMLADHGHVDVTKLDICEHEDLYACLSKKVTMEKRCPSFFVKEDKRKEFEELFNKYYGEWFELLTKKQVLDMKLLGEGEPKEGVLDSFGDYLAIAKDRFMLAASKEFDRDENTKRRFQFKGHHAGGTKEEREIDVCMFNTK